MANSRDSSNEWRKETGHIFDRLTEKILIIITEAIQKQEFQRQSECKREKEEVPTSAEPQEEVPELAEPEGEIINEHDSSTIMCNVCGLSISSSCDSDDSKTVKEHLNSHQHIRSIEETENPLTLYCSSCDCVVPISADNDLSYHNIEIHLKGRRHRATVLAPISSNVVSQLAEPVEDVPALVEPEEEVPALAEPQKEVPAVAEPQAEVPELTEPEWEIINDHDSSTIMCNVCGLSISSSCDSDDSKTVKVHLNSHQHIRSIEETENPLTLYCSFCDCFVPISADNDLSYHNIEIHLKGRRHRATVLAPISSKVLSQLAEPVEEVPALAEPQKEVPAVAEPQAEVPELTEPEWEIINDHDSSTILCNVCGLSISSSCDSDDSKTVKEHLDSHQHIRSIEETENPLTLYCSSCDCFVPISADNNLSYHNIEIHLKGRRHRAPVLAPISSKIVSQLAEPEEEAPALVEPEEEVPALAEPEEEVPALAEPEEEVPALAEPEEEVPALVEPEEEVPALAEPQKEVPALAEPQEEVPELTEPEGEIINDQDSSTILCNVCGLSISSSCDRDDFSKTVKEHLNSQQHIRSIEETENPLTLYCSSCDCFVPISADNNLSYHNIEIHLKGRRHRAPVLAPISSKIVSQLAEPEEEAPALVEPEYKELELAEPAKFPALIEAGEKVPELAGSVDEVPESAVSEEEVYELEKPVEDIINNQDLSTIICNVCKCTISCCHGSDIFVKTVKKHLFDKQHLFNLEYTYNSLSFYCPSCNCLVPISLDLYLSFKNVRTHIKGRKHSMHSCNPIHSINTFLSVEKQVEEYLYERDTSLVDCNVCKLSISCSLSNDILIKAIEKHLNDHHHKNNMQEIENTLSVYCSACDCNVPISERIAKSNRNIKIHFNSPAHLKKLSALISFEIASILAEPVKTFECDTVSPSILCNARDCSISSSIDANRLPETIKEHVNDQQRINKFIETENQQSALSSTCDQTVPISERIDKSYQRDQNIKRHSDEPRHLEEVSDSFPFEVAEPEKKVCELAKLEEVVSELPQNEININRNSSIMICNVCGLSFSYSFNEDTFLNTIEEHLNDQQHINTIKDTNNPKSFYCCLCEYTVKISEDILSSFNNIKIHANFHQHMNNIPESTLEGAFFTEEKNDKNNVTDTKTMGVEYSLPSYDDHNALLSDEVLDPISSESAKHKKAINFDQNASTIVCSVCELSISSYDDYLLLGAIKDHLNNVQHIRCITETENSRLFYCPACDCNLTISENIDKSYHNIETHLNGCRHLVNVSVAISSEAAPELVCNVCDCSICSLGEDNFLEIIKNHLEDEQHIINIKETDNPLTLYCSACDRNVPISDNINKSYFYIEMHMYGRRHLEKVPKAPIFSKAVSDLVERKVDTNNDQDSSTIICNVCELSISSSHNNDNLAKLVKEHLNSHRHIKCIEETENALTLYCSSCYCTVPISQVIEKSYHDIDEHLNSCRLLGDDSVFSETDPILAEPAEKSRCDIAMQFITCNVCDCPVYVSLGIDNFHDTTTLKEHLYDQQHIDNISEAKSSKSFFCSACSKTISIPKSIDKSLYNIKVHLDGKKHLKKIFNDLLDYRGNDILSQLTPESVEPEEQVFELAELKEVISELSQKETNFDQNSSTIICSVCELTISYSLNKNDFLKRIKEHLNDQQHIINIENTKDPKSLYCSLCQYTIPISNDIQSSFYNLQIHANSHQNINNIPESTFEVTSFTDEGNEDRNHDTGSKTICNVCKCPIPSDDDHYELLKSMLLHLYTQKHCDNIAQSSSQKSIYCGVCEDSVTISEDFHSSYYSILEHVSSLEHTRNLSKSFYSEYASKKHNSMKIEMVCNVCNCLMSNSDCDKLLYDVHIHIKGKRHTKKIKKAKKYKSVYCGFCETTILISNDCNLSYSCLVDHVESHRLVGNKRSISSSKSLPIAVLSDDSVEVESDLDDAEEIDSVLSDDSVEVESDLDDAEKIDSDSNDSVELESDVDDSEKFSSDLSDSVEFDSELDDEIKFNLHRPSGNFAKSEVKISSSGTPLLHHVKSKSLKQEKRLDGNRIKMALICNVCKCPEFCSNNPLTRIILLYNIQTHLNGRGHKRKMENSTNHKSFSCSLCECTVLISDDPVSSHTKIVEHINSHMPSGNSTNSVVIDQNN